MLLRKKFKTGVNGLFHLFTIVFLIIIKSIYRQFSIWLKKKVRMGGTREDGTHGRHPSPLSCACGASPC
jgi:hypothetical protein